MTSTDRIAKLGAHLKGRTPITSHVLDTSIGKPAEGIPIELEMYEINEKIWKKIGNDVTNNDGRIRQLMPDAMSLLPGTYRITFQLENYFQKQQVEHYFYPHVTIVFIIKDTQAHYHVPLLINPFGYSTYRGS